MRTVGLLDGNNQFISHSQHFIFTPPVAENKNIFDHLTAAATKQQFLFSYVIEDSHQALRDASAKQGAGGWVPGVWHCTTAAVVSPCLIALAPAAHHPANTHGVLACVWSSQSAGKGSAKPVTVHDCSLAVELLMCVVWVGLPCRCRPSCPMPS